MVGIFDSAYSRGRQAYADGISVGSNPYHGDSSCYNEWESGWCDAENDALEKKGD